ncbi:protein FAM83E [Brachyhypopomus gauderio]|uniref:protein FAM83E n=1 Tax=Brachyhypopomus gauderio TaxID=698409 RepID=UPI004041F369
MDHISSALPMFRLHAHAPAMISRSQEKSLDEDAVFQPLSESSPELVHCEVERQALEGLLSAGPGAFYARACGGRLGPFLSPEEVRQVSGWVEDYCSSEETQEDGDGADQSGSATQPFSVRYFPVHSDMPAPELELGWPEKLTWDGSDQAVVYTNPPGEQAPHIREVVRRILQGANTLIAIVTDRLTDTMVIRDLQCAASRGVPVYIILNRRSAPDSFTTDRLRHPNIEVRTVGGKVFLSRSGKMVTGDLKENFILVDLETVVLGSYSLTWTDAHLHRQLITVLRGPSLQAFDREFRILYATSMPVPDVWKPDDATGMHQLEGGHALYHSEHVEPNTHMSVLLQSPPSPPAPPTDSPIDWDTLGVTQWNLGFSEDPPHLPGLSEELPMLHRAGVERWMEGAGEGGDIGKLGWREVNRNVINPERALYKHLSGGTPAEWDDRTSMFMSRDLRMGMKLREGSDLFTYPLRRDNPLRMDTGLEDNTMSQREMPWRYRSLRMDTGLEDNQMSQREMPWRHRSLRMDTGLEDNTMSQGAMSWRHRSLRMDTGLDDNTMSQGAMSWRHRSLRMDTGLEDNTMSQGAISWQYRSLRMDTGMEDNTMSQGAMSWEHRSQRMDTGLENNAMSHGAVPWLATAADNHQKPLEDGFRTFGDILEKPRTRESSSGVWTQEDSAMVSRSLQDLRDQSDDASQMTQLTSGEHFPLTPAIALIKKRNDDIKAGLMRGPRAVIPRNYTFDLQREPWRSSSFSAQKSEEDK